MEFAVLTAGNSPHVPSRFIIHNNFLAPHPELLRSATSFRSITASVLPATCLGACDRFSSPALPSLFVRDDALQESRLIRYTLLSGDTVL
jgi:hypothetical protein